MLSKLFYINPDFFPEIQILSVPVYDTFNLRKRQLPLIHLCLLYTQPPVKLYKEGLCQIEVQLHCIVTSPYVFSHKCIPL